MLKHCHLYPIFGTYNENICSSFADPVPFLPDPDPQIRYLKKSTLISLLNFKQAKFVLIFLSDVNIYSAIQNKGQKNIFSETVLWTISYNEKKRFTGPGVLVNKASR